MRKWLILMAAGALSVLLTGCMGAVPIDQRMLVQAVGIDWQEGQYQVTLQIFSPARKEGESTGQEVCSAVGEDLAECMRGIRLETGQELFLGNCRLVILSEPAASERTAEVVDYLLSDHELRPGTPLYLTEGEAAALLESPELPAEQLSEMMRSAAEAGLCPDSTLLTVVRSLESLGSTAALGRIEADETGGVQASGAVLLGPEGTAELTPEQWRGVSYFSGDPRQLEYTLDYKGGKLYTHITPVQSRLTGGENPGELAFYLSVECTIQEYSGGTLNWDSAEVASVRAVAEQAVRRELEQGFAALRTAGADVICALETMEKFQPDFCRGRTPEAIFGSLVLRPEVQVNITALGAGAQASA